MGRTSYDVLQNICRQSGVSQDDVNSVTNVNSLVFNNSHDDDVYVTVKKQFYIDIMIDKRSFYSFNKLMVTGFVKKIIGNYKSAI